jgi:hypothetical protein
VQIFEEAGAIPRLPRRNFSLGRRDTQIAAPQKNFLLAGAICQLPRRNFSFSQHNPSIAAL